MKIVLNKDYDGFHLPKEYCNLCNCGPYDWDFGDVNHTIRIDPVFVKIVEGGCDNSDLKVIEIPDAATDWDLYEYDGMESLVYVVDGKLHWA